jgi:hypothetical protein
MTKEFIPYEQSLELKNLGFDEPCLIKDTEQGEDFAVYYVHQNGIPTFSQAFRFFREKYPDFDFGVGKIYNGSNTYHYHINLIWEYFEGTYEEAELSCLIKLIEICKTK